MVQVAINPGSGPVDGGKVRASARAIAKFVADLKLDGVCVERDATLDEGGRFGWCLTLDGRAVVVEMPGLPLRRVRWMRRKDQNIWDFPRLYVDGSSWVWFYALNDARRGLLGRDED